MSTARRRTRPLLLHTLVLLGAAAVLACGVPVDDEPRAIQEEASTTTVASTPSTGQVSSMLYYVREGSLVPFERDLPNNSAEAAIDALGQSSSAILTAYDLSSSIPSGTELIGTLRDDGRLVVNLSSAFDNVVGRSRQQAIGQMVMSVTQERGIDTVEFQVEGRPITVSSPARGDRSDVGACDYQSLLANAEDITELPSSSVRTLAERTEQLDEECVDLTG